MVPWKGKTLIGVWHRVYQEPSEDIQIGREEVEEWLREVNESCPGMDLKIEDVLSWDYGLVPFGKSDPQSKDLHFGHESQFLDHQQLDGISHLLSLIGIRYTMGRGDGERAVNWALRSLGRTVPRSTSHTTPVRGGDINDFSGLEKEIHARAAKLGVSDRSLALLKDHGTDYQEVLAYIEADPSLAQRCGDSTLTAAEVIHAVRHEAVVTLEDLVLRRTDLGVTGCPGDAALYACAEILARELDWTTEDIEREIARVRRFYPDFRAESQLPSDQSHHAETPA
jgi:glycerol-3-phosphate dehydrogenase